jgi:hypothetical protein
LFGLADHANQVSHGANAVEVGVADFHVKLGLGQGDNAQQVEHVQAQLRERGSGGDRVVAAVVALFGDKFDQAGFKIVHGRQVRGRTGVIP